MAAYDLDLPFIADAAIGSAASGPDLATSYDYFIAVKGGTANGHVTPVTTAATDIVLGIAQQRVLAADATKIAINVRVSGVSKWLVGTGGVTRFTRVTKDATGKCVAVGAAGTEAEGIALQTGAAGDVVDVFLTPNGVVPA